MDKVTGMQVFMTFMADARRSVDALLELAKDKCDSDSPLLKVVRDSIDKSFADMEIKVVGSFNSLIDAYNNREATIAKVNHEEKPEKDGDGCLVTGHAIPICINDFGIKRVKDTKAWMLELNHDEVSGTGMDEETAWRLQKDSMKKISRLVSYYLIYIIKAREIGLLSIVLTYRLNLIRFGQCNQLSILRS